VTKLDRRYEFEKSRFKFGAEISSRLWRSVVTVRISLMGAIKAARTGTTIRVKGSVKAARLSPADEPNTMMSALA